MTNWQSKLYSDVQNDSFLKSTLLNILYIVCIGVSPPPFLAKPPPLNRQIVQAPLFLGNPPLYIGFSRTPPKSRILQWNPKILKFFMLNTILSFKSN